MKTSTILGILLAIALLALGYCGIYVSNKHKAEIAGLTTANTELSDEIKDLQGLKTGLEKDLQDLQAKYSSLAAENEALQGSVEDAQREINKRKAVIYRLTKSVEAKDGEMASLRAQIEGLLNAKSQLEAEINTLKAENEALKAENTKLAADLATTRDEKAALARLNETMEADIANLTLKNFKASGFTVELEKRNKKATAKSRWARKVKVSFDLVDVPEKYHGVRKVYLVITDDTGVPIKKTSPISTKVNINGMEKDIIAVKEQDVDIKESQRLSFSHDLEEKLKKGFYRASVYTDLGLLGTASFRLR